MKPLQKKEEGGLYTSGVFLDALSAFWNSFYDFCTNGKDERVPVIRHDLQVAEWEAIARITVKGYQQVDLITIKKAKPLQQPFSLAKKL